MSGTQSLYERLGGRDAISAVVDEFYDRMLADERVAHYFEDVDMVAQRAHQTQFISSVAGGPVEYTGEDMRAAHDHLGLSHEDFAVTAEHLQGALEEFDVPPEEIEEVMTAVAGLEEDIVSD
ncbi:MULTISPECIES: group 1 truncated hemoglobin [Haloferax]|uniref:Group 1 truncated hemoglobin n=1 Tax=Haloferax marinum TaxID=2666143 RepID=A0A6A8G7F0_9EURY|nr:MULTISPECIES: group 1 truncated hemoglobin [Haloferax]KAB1197167.1 group 1 truncated hemoglobin [Haloferax sp. CBA1150]MRW96203.1 group 1 truncated hemoglobin [Haloferax marinum]